MFGLNVCYKWSFRVRRRTSTSITISVHDLAELILCLTEYFVEGRRCVHKERKTAIVKWIVYWVFLKGFSFNPILGKSLWMPMWTTSSINLWLLSMMHSMKAFTKCVAVKFFSCLSLTNCKQWWLGTQTMTGKN